MSKEDCARQTENERKERETEKARVEVTYRSVHVSDESWIASRHKAAEEARSSEWSVQACLDYK